MGTFAIDVNAFTGATIANIDIIRKKVILDLFGKVVKKTPVDSGRARGNWQASVGSPASGVLDRMDKTGIAALADIRKAAAGSYHTDTVFLTNNIPYITTLEYGGFPNPPKKGKGKSKGGFSKQAPQGMLRISIAEFPQIVSKNAKKQGFGG